jgi:hypothetical protein
MFRFPELLSLDIGIKPDGKRAAFCGQLLGLLCIAIGSIIT